MEARSQLRHRPLNSVFEFFAFAKEEPTTQAQYTTDTKARSPPRPLTTSLNYAGQPSEPPSTLKSKTAYKFRSSRILINAIVSVLLGAGGRTATIGVTGGV
jgi:hypothetical protein